MEDGEEGGERKRGRPKKETEKLPRKKKVKPGEPGYDPYDFTSSEEEEEEDTPPGSHDLQQKSYGSQPEEEDMDTGTTTVRISDQRYLSAYYTHPESCISHYNPPPPFFLPPPSSPYPRLADFRSSVVKAFSSEHSQSMAVEHLTSLVNSLHADAPFSQGEVTSALDHMQEANQVMVSEEMVFLI